MKLRIHDTHRNINPAIMLNVTVLSVMFYLSLCIECYYAECHGALFIATLNNLE